MDRLAEGEECAVSALNHFLLRQLKGRSEKDYSRDSRVYRYGRCSFTLGPGFVPGAGYGPGAGFDSSTASGPAQVSAPDLTADEVVNKYLDALGGRDAIGKVKTMSVEGTMQVMGGDAPTTTITVDGVGAKQESEFNGTKIISCYTDKAVGW